MLECQCLVVQLALFQTRGQILRPPLFFIFRYHGVCTYIEVIFFRIFAQLHNVRMLQPAACVLLFCTWLTQLHSACMLQPAACSMRTLCSWAKILRNITSRLARQKIWKNYACCTCSMRRKTTSLDFLKLHIFHVQAGPSMMWFFYACCRCSMRSFLPG